MIDRSICHVCRAAWLVYALPPLGVPMAVSIDGMTPVAIGHAAGMTRSMPTRRRPRGMTNNYRTQQRPPPTLRQQHSLRQCHVCESVGQESRLTTRHK